MPQDLDPVFQAAGNEWNVDYPSRPMHSRKRTGVIAWGPFALISGPRPAVQGAIFNRRRPTRHVSHVPLV